MDEKIEGRRRLAVLVAADRGRIYRTVDRARIAAKVSRGTWDSVEAARPVKDFSLSAIEEALGWPAGRAQRILRGDESTGELPPESDLRRHVLSAELPEPVRRAMLALLDSVPDVDAGEAPPAGEGGVRGA